MPVAETTPVSAVQQRLNALRGAVAAAPKAEVGGLRAVIGAPLEATPTEVEGEAVAWSQWGQFSQFRQQQ